MNINYIFNRFYQMKDAYIGKTSILRTALLWLGWINDAILYGASISDYFAYAFDKPCLVTRTGGLPEMVGNGEYGLLLPHVILKNYRDYSEGNKSWEYVVKDMYLNVYNAINI